MGGGDLALFFSFFAGSSWAQASRISIIPHRQQFVNRQFQQKIKPIKSHNCATLPIDIPMEAWYNVYCQEGNATRYSPYGLVEYGNTCELKPKTPNNILPCIGNRCGRKGAVNSGQVRTDTNPMTAMRSVHKQKSPEFFVKTS